MCRWNDKIYAGNWKEKQKKREREKKWFVRHNYGWYLKYCTFTFYMYSVYLCMHRAVDCLFTVWAKTMNEYKKSQGMYLSDSEEWGRTRGVLSFPSASLWIFFFFLESMSEVWVYFLDLHADKCINLILLSVMHVDLVYLRMCSCNCIPWLLCGPVPWLCCFSLSTSQRKNVFPWMFVFTSFFCLLFIHLSIDPVVKFDCFGV